MVNNTPTIVVVDDSAEVRSLIKMRLALSGLMTVVGDGADGTDAIELAHQHRPSLLLLDISMPTMDGLEALPGILTVSPNTRVVIYSGFEQRGLAERASEFGAAAFIEKSLPIEELPARLIAILSRQKDPPGRHSLILPRGLKLIVNNRSGNEDKENVDDQNVDDQSVLDEHLERFREVFEEAAIGMATMTLTGSIVRANRALGDLMMSKHQDLAGIDYGRLMSGHADLLDAALSDINENSTPLAHIEHPVTGAPEPRRVLATLAPVRDSSGKALYVFLQVQDITAQRAAEDELRESEERFRLLVEAVEDYAIFMLSPTGVVVSWNAGAQRSKGYRADEIIGRHFRTFYTEDQQRARHPEHELELALRDGQYAEEGWRVRKDGSRFWAHVLITAVFDEAGRHLGFAKVTRDTTERRLADQEREATAAALATANFSLGALNDQLRQAIADQSQSLALTAHELRTPATVLGGSADTLVGHWDDLTSEERQSLLDAMVTSAVQMRRLLSELLTAASLGAESLQLTKVAIPLSAVVTTAVRAVKIADPDAEITIDVTAEVDVVADADRLCQAIDNLIRNALQHGAPPIRVKVEATTRIATIRVSDAGQGVPPKLLPRLFERFSTGGSPGGVGLGLFIVRELARAQGGDAVYEPGTPENPAGEFVLSMPRA